MTTTQDPTHPTGVATTSPRGNSELSRARERKMHAALEMRRSGCDWTEIAETLGYPSGEMARTHTEKALEDGLLAPESQEFLRHLAASRLEELLGAVYKQAIDDEHPEQLAYHTAARSTIKDQADLLGFAAPKTFVVNNPSVARIEAWVAAVAAEGTTGVEEADIFEMEAGEDGVFSVPDEEDADAAPAE